MVLSVSPICIKAAAASTSSLSSRHCEASTDIVLIAVVNSSAFVISQHISEISPFAVYIFILLYACKSNNVINEDIRDDQF